MTGSVEGFFGLLERRVYCLVVLRQGSEWAGRAWEGQVKWTSLWSILMTFLLALSIREKVTTITIFLTSFLINEDI